MNSRTVIGAVAVLAVAGLQGCAINVNEQNTRERAPFAVEQMRGTPQEAALCVGKYWRSSVQGQGSIWGDWIVSIMQDSVTVRSPGGSAPVIGLVVDFDEQGGKTIAYAHVHRIFDWNDQPQTVVTKQALQMCKVGGATVPIESEAVRLERSRRAALK